jgi:NitT/TauT family transport system ATP-binding protein
MRDEILRADSLFKSYGNTGSSVPVLANLSLSVRQGEFVSVVGPSGCGKTTLLMALAGLVALDGGQVLFKGNAVAATPVGVAVVFQDYSRSLLPWKRNVDNVLFGMRRLSDLTRRDKKSQAFELMKAVGLEGFERHFPWQLSGGMQQRVAIARAIASESELLLLDEPLAALDAQTRADLQDLLLAIADRYQQTCLLVTHDVDEAVYMADRVVVLSSRPAKVLEEVGVSLPRPRDQLATREDRRFLEVRHNLLELVRRKRAGVSGVSLAETSSANVGIK